MTAEVTDARDRNRYEVRSGGELAGFAAYERHGDQVVFTHTEIEPAFEGKGLAGVLARHALDDVRRRGLAVVPRCPFIAGWIKRHPDYQDLVPEEHRALLDR